MKDGKSADKSHDWIDTWRSMEELYRDYSDKIRAIGEHANSCSFQILHADRIISKVSLTSPWNI
jgi:glycerol 2-dehydrogenase (NADP+)